MKSLINSSNLIGEIAERRYADGYDDKAFDLLDVQTFWTNALVCFGDVERAVLIALLATTGLDAAERQHVRRQIPLVMWERFEALTGDEIWPVPVDFTTGEDDLESLKASLIEKIDRDAEIQRLVYITNGAGQAMAYQQKYVEAILVLSGDSYEETEIPHIVAEAAVSEISVSAQATIVRDAFLLWCQVSAQIEAKRITAKKAIQDATTVAAAYQGAEIDWTLT